MLLGGLLLVRIVLPILQVLMDYKLLSGKYGVNFMEVSDLFSYPLLLLIIYIAIKYHAILTRTNKESNEILKSFLIFIFLFLMNIFIFKILAILGFQVTMSENGYILPLCFRL